MTHWTNNRTALEGVCWMKARQRLLIVTHAKPDGDAIGSTAALGRALRSAGVKAEQWYIDPVPLWSRAILGGDPHRIWPSDVKIDAELAGEFDGVIIADTGSWGQLAGQRPVIEALAHDALLIDHHLHGDADVASQRIIDTQAAAAAEIVAPLCGDLLNSTTAALPSTIADALYLGIATDTGWFRFSNVRPLTFRLAADLLTAGARPNDLYALIEQQDSISRWRLLSKALATLETHVLPERLGGGLLATMSLRLSDFDSAGAGRSETPGFADMPLTIAGVRASAVLTEGEAGNNQGAVPLTKISIRSKPDANAVDVNEAMRSLGGGGHARAAGAKINMSLSQAHQALLKALS